MESGGESTGSMTRPPTVVQRWHRRPELIRAHARARREPHSKGQTMMTIHLESKWDDPRLRARMAKRCRIPIEAFAAYQRGVILATLQVAPDRPTHCHIAFLPQRGRQVLARVAIADGETTSFAQALGRSFRSKRAFDVAKRVEGLSEDERQRLRWEVYWVPAYRAMEGR